MLQATIYYFNLPIVLYKYRSLILDLKNDYNILRGNTIFLSIFFTKKYPESFRSFHPTCCIFLFSRDEARPQVSSFYKKIKK